MAEFNYERVKQAITDLLGAIGEDPLRAGLVDTPRRVADFYQAFIEHDAGKTDTVFESIETDQLVAVSGMRVWSLCVPSRQQVDVAGGQKRAADVRVGDEMWTLVNGRATLTKVEAVTSYKTCQLVRVETDEGAFEVTPDHPFATPDGWVEAQDLGGLSIEWTAPRSLCRNRFEPRLGRSLGYTIGAMFADGTVGDRYLSLVVNEEWFAEKFAVAIEDAFPGVEADVEPCSRPSGFTGKDTPGFRVRVVSSYLADLFRVWAGGDAHHMRQRFPRVVLNSLDTMQGFLDGYIDGDGSRSKQHPGCVIVSANVEFLAELAEVIDARFTPSEGVASQLYVPDRWARMGWFGKHGFRQEDHRTSLVESRFVKVRSVTLREAEGNKPFTVYSFKCGPYPTFTISGHLAHNCEHHLLPFHCDIGVAYLAADRVLGLSKFARIAHKHASKLQLQERLVHDIATELKEILKTSNIAVIARGEHSCTTMRGVRTPHLMTSSAMLGVFREDAAARAEVLALLSPK